VKTLPSPPLVAGIVVTGALIAGTTGVTGTAQAGAPAIALAPAREATAQSPLARTPRTYRLKIHPQYQSTDYYCVPASIAMSLATFGVKVGQRALATRMKTTQKGTGGDNATKVIDAYIHPRRYDDRLVGDVVGHPSVLMDRVSYDVGTLRRAPVIQVWMEQLPWNRTTVKGHLIGHAIIAYGYDRTAGTITVFDPWRPTGGPHTIPAGALAQTLQGGGGMHYISRI
jgi:hypothetical protein